MVAWRGLGAELPLLRPTLFLRLRQCFTVLITLSPEESEAYVLPVAVWYGSFTTDGYGSFIRGIEVSSTRW